MTDNIVNTTIEISGRIYSVRCTEEEEASLQSAAAFLSEKIAEVKESGKALNLERIVMMTALNIAHEFLMLNEQCTDTANRINQRITQMQGKLDTAMNKPTQTELIYMTE